MTDLVHKKRELSVNLLRFLRHVVPMHWPGHGCDGGEPGQSWSAESVISVWTHLGGHCLRRLSWAFLMWFPAPDSFRPRRVEFTKSVHSVWTRFALLDVRLLIRWRGQQATGQSWFTKRRTQRGLSSLSSACGPHAWVGNGWDGGGRGQSLFTKSVHSDRVNSPGWPVPVAMGPGSFRCVVPCARILPCPQGLTSRST